MPQLSREARSENYCAQFAGVGTVLYDPNLLLACRREEYTAAARLGRLSVPPGIDTTCAATASLGDPIRFFSWSRYALCVERLAPPSDQP